MKYTTSVVIPCYLPRASANDLSLLNKAVLSAVEQDYPDEMEIILVDDGNKIPIENLIDINSYPCNVRVIHQRRNMGLVLALNRGINEANFNYIARLDADDTWDPGKVRAQFDLFRADPNLTLVATGMTRVTPSGQVIDEHIRPDGWSNIAQFFVEYGCPFPHGSVLARKDIYQALGLYSQDATFAHCEDYHLWGQWIRFFKTSMVEKSYYRYTVSSSSVSGQNSEQQSRASQIVLHHFRAIGLDQSYVDDIGSLSNMLGIQVIELGHLLLSIWRSTGAVLKLPSEVLPILRRILTDRVLCETNEQNSIKFPALVNEKRFNNFVNIYVAFA